MTALRWLVELRSKLIKDGPGTFRSRVSLSLQRSRPQHQSQGLARTGTGPLPEASGSGVVRAATTTATPVVLAQDALAAMLAGANSPFLVQMVEGAVVMEAVSAAAVGWLRTADAADLVFLAQVGLTV